MYKKRMLSLIDLLRKREITLLNVILHLLRDYKLSLFLIFPTLFKLLFVFPEKIFSVF